MRMRAIRMLKKTPEFISWCRFPQSTRTDVA